MITVEAPQSLFPTLYDGSAKTIVIGQAFAGQFSPPERLPVTVLHALFSETGNVLRLEEPTGGHNCGSPRRLLVPPANVWCLVRGEDDAAVRAADRLIAWWHEVGGVKGAPDVCSNLSPELERCLLERALSELAETQSRNVALQRSLSALRDEWASTARIPPEINEVLENLRLSPPRLVFASDKLEGETVVPVTEPQENWRETAAILVQPFPVWSRGIIEIDVHVMHSAPSSGALCASLYAVDGDRVLATWRIPFADLRPGWLPLRVATALDRSFRALELRLCAVGFEPPRLSIASTGLFDELAMKIRPDATGGSNCDAVPSRMLALRIWGALPGTRWDVSTGGDAHPLSGELAVSLPDHIVARAHATRDFTASFRWFDPLPGGRVLLHPLYNRVAAARIPLLPTSALRAVNCEVMIEDNRRRTPIACKLVVTAPEITADQAESEEQVLASSGWMVLLQPQHSYLLSAPLNRLYSGPVNLHLFTRVADDGPDYYGRTIFGRFELRIDRKSAWQMPPILACSNSGN